VDHFDPATRGWNRGIDPRPRPWGGCQRWVRLYVPDFPDSDKSVVLAERRLSFGAEDLEQTFQHFWLRRTWDAVRKHSSSRTVIRLLDRSRWEMFSELGHGVVLLFQGYWRVAGFKHRVSGLPK